MTEISGSVGSEEAKKYTQKRKASGAYKPNDETIRGKDGPYKGHKGKRYGLLHPVKNRQS